MMKMRKHRFAASLLACLLCFMTLPVTAFAGGEPETEEAVTETVEETVEEPTEDIVEEPTEEPVEDATGDPAEEPEQNTVEEPVEDPAENTGEETVDTVTTPEYRVEVDDLDHYYNEPVDLTIRIEDVGGTGWQKAEASLDQDDPERRTNLTESLLENGAAYYTVSDNCTVYFFITDLEGTEYMETYSVTCFDYDPPAVEAGIRNKLLRAEAVDALSGVAGIYVNGQLYTTLQDGVLDLRINNCTDEQLFSIRAVDRLGNKSGSVVLSNPFYEEPKEETPEDEDTKKDCPDDKKDQEPPAEITPTQPTETTPTQPAVTTPTQPAVTTPTQPAASSTGTSSGTGTAGKSSASQSSTTESAKAEETKEPVTKEPGEGFSENGNAVTRDLLYDKYTNKQFITITDRDGNTFYMVIDYDSPINEDEEQYQTYFLNPVDTADLLALTGEDTAETLATCSCTEPCQPGAVNMNCEICAKDMTQCVCKATVPVPEQTEDPAETEPEAEEPEKTGSGLNPVVLVLVLALVGGGGALAYFKLVKNKPKTKGDADLDDYDYGEEEDTEEDAPWESVEEDAADSEKSEDDMD